MDESIIRRKRKRRGSKLFLFVPVPILVLALLLNSSLRAPLLEEARIRTEEAARNALNTAAERVLDSGTDFGLLEMTQTGEDSFIINADTAKLSRVLTKLTSNASELMAELGMIGAEADLGALSGILPLSGRGPRVRVRFEPVGAVETQPFSKLTACGINQSLYTLCARLTVTVRLFAAGKSETVTVKTTVPIAETVIVGRVPQVYTNVANEEDMLNLVPTDIP